MFRLFDHIFKKYRIISYYSDTAYIAVVHDLHWKAISQNILYYKTQYKHNCLYDKGRYNVYKPSKPNFEWHFGKSLKYPCHSWIESYCMVDSIEKAEHMIKLHKEYKHKK